jgi:protein TonB
MLISKFDLYNPEWLELVFEDRNKAYGAYDLRRHHNRTMGVAMAITFSTIALFVAAGMVFHSGTKIVSQQPPEVVHEVILSHPPVEPVKKIDPPAPLKLKPQPPAPQVNTIKDPPLVVVADPLSQSPPKNDDLAKAAIGLETAKGVPTTANKPLETSAGPGTAAPAPPANIVYDTYGVDVMPMPVGGEAAWAKFLNKNLRYPPAAQEEGVGGRVFMSFIVEKDGTLSNINIERAAGHGFDEEAARVLKLAKAWKPGMQNGQAVRVKYIIPINFQFNDQP